MAKTGTVDVASVTSRNIYYEDTETAGPVVVFSHGFLMDHTMFAAQVDALKSQYRCITWDQRGHGLTATDQLSPFSFYDSANDLSGLLAALKIEKAVLAGMSQGGFLTLRCALTNPDLVQALILMDTEADVMSSGVIAGDNDLLDTWISAGCGPDLAAAIAHQIIGPTLPGWNQQPYWSAQWGAMKLVNLIQSFNALVTRDDISSVIGAIKVPALVVHGERDLSVPLAAGYAMQNGLKSPNFTLVPDAGHAANLTHPDVVNAAILAFLTQYVPSTPQA